MAQLSVGQDWLPEVRQAARQRFEEAGVPTPDREAWKNTNLSALSRFPFEPQAASPAPDELPAGWATLALSPIRLVFVDGRFAPNLSRLEACPPGVRVESLRQLLEQEPAVLRPHFDRSAPRPGAEFHDLNTSLFEDGTAVIVPDRTSVPQPIQIVHVAGSSDTPGTSHPRTLIVAGQGSAVRVVETYAALDDSPYLRNCVTEVSAGNDSSVELYRVQVEGSGGLHLSSSRTRQARDSRVSVCQIDLGGKLARHSLHSVLEGEGGHCSLAGLYLTRGKQHVDNHTTLEHASPNCDSRELYKGVLGDDSRSVFTGRIVVQRDAQHTDAKQSNPNLLLSTRALAHTRPQLEIYADDVKCTHGATIGQVDEEAVYYLRTRGIDRTQARNLLIRAFVGEVLDRVALAPLREALEHAVSERLPGARG